MAQATQDADLGKKCAFSGKPIKRARRFYRNGKYYLNKASFKANWPKIQEEKAKAKEEAKAKLEASKVEAQKAPEQAPPA